MKVLSSLALVVPILLVSSLAVDFEVVPDTPASGPSSVQWTASSAGFDGPKVKLINATTYDWWYFDAVSTEKKGEGLKSIVVVFYTSTGAGFDLLAGYTALGFTSVDLVQVTASWPNGTEFQTIINATQADIVVAGNGASGIYEGGAAFVGSPDMSSYIVTINSPKQGIVGSLRLKSVAPAHAPCGPAVAGANLQLFPHVGWVNAVPDANAKASFIIQGEQFEFTGPGYHDKNWGDATFSDQVDSWYWGHSHLGSYSVVWFDAIARNGQNYISAYVAQHNKIIAAQCSGIKVRPTGANSTYPPLLTTGPPSGFHVDIDIPAGKLSFDVQVEQTILSIESLPYSPYYRWIGTLSGGLNGAKDLTGSSVFEQFAFLTT